MTVREPSISYPRSLSDMAGMPAKISEWVQMFSDLFFITEEFVTTQTDDYQCTHIKHTHLTMNNSTEKTVTFDINPLNGQRVSIHLENSKINIDPNGKVISTVDGDQTLICTSKKGPTFDFVYFDLANNGKGNGLDKWVFS